MDNLVKIEKKMIGQEIVDAVNARELHGRLEVGRDFSNWIKQRIEETMAKDRLDYLEVAQSSLYAKFGENPLGGRPSKEYIITLDLAKHIAMLERSEIGYSIRQYFIDFEKEQKAIMIKEERYANDPVMVMTKNYLDIKYEQERQRAEQDRQRDEQIKLLQSIILHDQQIKEQNLLMHDQKRLLDEQSHSIDVIKSVLPKDGYYTIKGWCNLIGIKCPNSTARSYGLKASKLSRKMGITIGKETDPVHGTINSYHRIILEQIIAREEIIESYHQMEFGD